MRQAKRAQYCLFEPNSVYYGRKSDEIIHDSDSPTLKPKKKNLQRIIGSFLYYARAVDCTILTAINTMALEQSNPTERTLKRVHQFLNYMATHPNAVIIFRVSDMILNIHSDA